MNRPSARWRGGSLHAWAHRPRFAALPLGRRLQQRVADQLLQERCARIGMAAVLLESFRTGDAERLAPPLRPALHRADEIVDRVLLCLPTGLALVTGEHALLDREAFSDIDAEFRHDARPFAI